MNRSDNIHITIEVDGKVEAELRTDFFAGVYDIPDRMEHIIGINCDPVTLASGCAELSSLYRTAFAALSDSLGEERAEMLLTYLAHGEETGV